MSDKSSGRVLYERVFPLRVRQRPMTILYMFMWVGIGVELFRTNLPLDLWPQEIDLTNPSQGFTREMVAIFIIVSGLMMLVGYLTAHDWKWAAFTSWVGTCVASAISFTFVFALVRVFLVGEYLWPEIALAAIFWTFNAVFLAVFAFETRRYPYRLAA